MVTYRPGRTFKTFWRFGYEPHDSIEPTWRYRSTSVGNVWKHLGFRIYFKIRG